MVPQSLTKSGRVRLIQVNPELQYFKVKQKTLLSSKETCSIYARRKIDVERVFGRMKASLGFNRFMLWGIDKVRKEIGILITALTMHKLAVRERNE
ncbi:transposase [Enterococcus sp. DIV1314a]|uniref:transposase n=1 Tax=Enterococcus sp. DIV1314a TaxID=2774660 RepID=UPI003F687DF3